MNTFLCLNVLDISDIIDNQHTDEYLKRIQLIGQICLELRNVKDIELMRIINRIRLKCDLAQCVDDLRIWCANHRISLYTVADRGSIQDGRA
jgi:hypothetical protein